MSAPAGRAGGLVAAAALMIAGTANAGDYAERSIYGFSADGATFAFEEYGTQDGSGFPYSNIYVIDTVADDWVAGTPIRVLKQDEIATLTAARQEALNAATAILQSRQVGVPGELVVVNPATETSANPRFASFRPRLAVLATSPDYRLVLEEYTLPASGCPDMGQPFQGFRLTLTGPDGGSRVLNQDARIPASRNCPLSYAISDVVTFYPQASATPVIVVLLSVYSVGFEGPDRRFMAIATR